MPILFALIIHSHVYSGDVWQRVAVYEKFEQCKTQAAKIFQGNSGYMYEPICLPTNK